jgi:hypothetical protein
MSGSTTPSRRRRVLAIVLAKDEEQRVGEVVHEILAEGASLPFELDVAVVDDGSVDGTLRAARRAGARVLRHPVNLRIGAAEQTGIRWALSAGYDAAVRLDGDGQHPAAGIRAMVDALWEEELDMVVGSRFLERGDGYLSTPLRKVGIGFISGLVSLVARRRVTDPTSGFRTFGPRAMKLLAMLPASDYPEPETLIDVHRAGLRAAEVPVPFRARTSGHSSIGPLRAVYYMTKITLAVLIAGIRRPIKV